MPLLVESCGQALIVPLMEAAAACLPPTIKQMLPRREATTVARHCFDPRFMPSSAMQWGAADVVPSCSPTIDKRHCPCIGGAAYLFWRLGVQGIACCYRSSNHCLNEQSMDVTHWLESRTKPSLFPHAVSHTFLWRGGGHFGVNVARALC